MSESKVKQMPFAKIYPLLVHKVTRLGGTQADVDLLISWLTGYSIIQIHELSTSTIDYASFFKEAPAYHPAAKNIKGVVCGVRVETIEDPLMRQIRVLDLLVDRLAKGQSVQKIIRKWEKE